MTGLLVFLLLFIEAGTVPETAMAKACPLYAQMRNPPEQEAGSVGWYRSFMGTPNLEELLALDVQARLALVQELWDSILKDAETGTELPISDDERRELDARLREDDDHPVQAIPWQEARSRLRNGQ